jgi:hypothetical protein
MPSWTIKGETGKALDAQARSFETLGAEDVTLRFRRLETDELTWFCPAEPSLSGLLVPDFGQEVSLWDGATRKFRGHVIAPRATINGLHVAASGPWWWLDQTPITSSRADESGTSASRPTYVFPEGELGGMIRALLDAAAAAGLPIAGANTSSNIPDLYDVPQISISLQSFAAGLAELLAWCPDAVAWWDYATGHDASDNPRLYVARRGDLTAVTYTIGTDPLGEATEIEPEYGLQVSRVELPFAKRNSITRAIEWDVQTDGTAAPGRVQVIPISGPEIDTTLPPEVESFETMVPYAASTTPGTILRMHLPGAQKLYNDWSVNIITAAYSDPYSGTNGSTWYVNGGASVGQAAKYVGAATSIPSGKTALCFGLGGSSEPPDWVVQRYGLTRWHVNDFLLTDDNSVSSSDDIIRRQAVIEVAAPTLFFSSSEANGTGSGAYSYKHFVRRLGSDQFPIFLIDSADVPVDLHSGTAASGTSASQIVLASGASAVDDFYNGLVIFWVTGGVRHGAVISDYVGSTRIATLAISQQSEKAPASGAAYVIPTPLGFDATSRYSFLSPPAGLAENLRTAQNWVPYKGTIELLPDAATGDNLLPKKFNLAGSLTPAATAGALAKEVEHAFAREVTRILLGAPPRQDYRTLVNRVRRSGQDNLVWL